MSHRCVRIYFSHFFSFALSFFVFHVDIRYRRTYLRLSSVVELQSLTKVGIIDIKWDGDGKAA